MGSSIKNEIQRIDSLEVLDQLFDRFFIKNTLTNNYLLSKEYQDHITSRDLFYAEEGGNAFIFLQKDNFFRVYYFINAPSVPFSIPIKHPLVLEILYRGEKKFPHQHTQFWERSGFKPHLRRDCYFLKENKTIHSSTQGASEVEIRTATGRAEAIYAKQLIDNYLDLYTGDILGLDEINGYLSEGLLYCAYWRGEPCGILQANFKNSVFWLDHIVVDPNYRGQGVASALIAFYLREGQSKHCSRYQLWVIHDNTPAVRLYEKYGFQYLNKSTISMLKQHD